MKTIIPDGSQLTVSPLELREAPWNPRRDRNQDALDALTASVRDVGILQPLVVREAGDGGLEVICGHRRLAAALAAGLEQVPAVLRHIDDQGAYNLAVTENLQREDLTAVDEAEAYKALMAGGMTADEVAARAGRSKSHVYLRLKLLELPEAATEAVRDGRMTEAIAALIGRIPGAAQREEAVEKILAGARIAEYRPTDEGGPVLEPMSYRAARKLLVDGFMLTLAGAPFDVDDPMLVPAAGSCANCHHRSGNQVDLFGDVVAEGGADVCTYPACYESKREAHADAVCAETGLKRLKIVEMDKTFPPGSASIMWNAKWVDADHPGQYGQTGKKTIRRALGDAAPQEFVAIDGEGKVRHLFRKKDVQAALKAMEPVADDRLSARQEAKNADIERLEVATLKVISDVIVARGANPDTINTERMARAAAAIILARAEYSPDPTHGFDSSDMISGEILKELKPIGMDTLIVLMAEAVLMPLVYDATEGCLNDNEVWAEMEKIYGFTLANARKQAQAAINTEDRAATTGASPEPAAPAPASSEPAKSKKKVAKKAAKKVTKKAVKKTAKKVRSKK